MIRILLTISIVISIQSIICFTISNPSSQTEIVIIDGRQQQQPLTTTTTTTTTASILSNQSNHQYQLINNNNNNNHNNKNNQQHDNNHELPSRRFQVAKFDFEHVSTPYIILLWIIIVGLAKMGFHVTPKLSSICPESVVLMILGVIIGLIMYFAGIPEERLQPLTPNLFFLYMLPPIVMDAGYHMPNRLFFDNLISILLYAVIGTIWNALAIGFSLYFCSNIGLFGAEEIPFLDIMLFSSTVSAVDPVAVLAVFEEIHVNEVLYILVFGESLLNDGVTVVLYHMFEGYAEMAYHYGLDSIETIDLIAGVASFFVVAIGGTTMGICWGFLAAFVSRFTHHVKIIEPIFVFVMAYLSYLSAEMFHLSGILSLTFCGITMKNYVEENITQKSHTTLKYAMKMLANSSEAIIFVFLGVCTVNDQHHWNTAFVTLTIVFCLLYRTIGVLILTAITNRYRLHKVNRVEQFIMSYGGLRGAVAFALILIINRQIIHAREMMVTTIIAVVYFTVFLQGMTVGTLVKILNVPRANKFELTMNERIHTRLMDHLMAGIEDISGMMMGNYKLRDKFRYYNNQYLRKWLLRDSKEMGNLSRKIFETCSRLDLRDAMTLVTKQQQHQQNSYIKTTTTTTTASYTNNNFIIDEDDYKNNNIQHPYNNQNIPKIFLTVPNGGQKFINNNQQVKPILIDPNQSLTSLFRTFTQSNLASLYNNVDDNQIVESSNESINDKSKNLDFNYDIGTVVYSPSLKDLKDAELHHILNDAMFKPFKKAHHYTRSDYFDEDETALSSKSTSPHPPFQHQVRMQIRRLISERENRERRRRHTHHSSYHNYSNHNNFNNSNSKFKSENQSNIKQQHETIKQPNQTIKSNDNNLRNLKRSKSVNEIDDHQYNNDDNDKDDEGITFVAGKLTLNNNNDKQQQKQQQENKLNFPWNQTPSPVQSNENENYDSITLTSSQEQQQQQPKQQELSDQQQKQKPKQQHKKNIKDGVIRQREFPSWIDNRDYVDDYCSPTTTLLQRINFYDNVVDVDNTTTTATSSDKCQNDDNCYHHHQQQTKKVPSVYEIFDLDKTNESNDDDENNKKLMKENFGSNDTVIELKDNHQQNDDDDDVDEDDSLVIISKL